MRLLKQNCENSAKECNTKRKKVWRDLLCLTSIEHSSVDEVRAHNGGLDAIFSTCQQLQTHRLCKTYCCKLTGTVVCRKCGHMKKQVKNDNHFWGVRGQFMILVVFVLQALLKCIITGQKITNCSEYLLLFISPRGTLPLMWTLKSTTYLTCGRLNNLTYQYKHILPFDLFDVISIIQPHLNTLAMCVRVLCRNCLTK